MQIKLNAVKQDKQRCPYCHGDILPTEETTGCVQCSAWFHEECWLEHGGCTNCPPVLASGAPAAPAPILRARLVSPRRPRRRRASGHIVAIGTPVPLIQAQQKRDAAAYARSKAFLPSLVFFGVTFLLSLPVLPAGSPGLFLFALLSIGLGAFILFGVIYVSQRKKRLELFRRNSLKRRRRLANEEAEGQWEHP